MADLNSSEIFGSGFFNVVASTMPDHITDKMDFLLNVSIVSVIVIIVYIIILIVSRVNRWKNTRNIQKISDNLQETNRKLDKLIEKIDRKHKK